MTEENQSKPVPEISDSFKELIEEHFRLLHTPLDQTEIDLDSPRTIELLKAMAEGREPRQPLGEFLFENDATVPLTVNLGWNEYHETPDWWEDFSVYYSFDEAIEVFGLSEEYVTEWSESREGLRISYNGVDPSMFLSWVQTHRTGWLAYVEICMRQDICVHASGDRLSYVAADHKYISWVYADTMPELETSIRQYVTDKAMEMTMKQSNWVPGEWEKWEKVLAERA